MRTRVQTREIDHVVPGTVPGAPSHAAADHHTRPRPCAASQTLPRRRTPLAAERCAQPLPITPSATAEHRVHTCRAPRSPFAETCATQTPHPARQPKRHLPGAAAIGSCAQKILNFHRVGLYATFAARFVGLLSRNKMFSTYSFKRSRSTPNSSIFSNTTPQQHNHTPTYFRRLGTRI